MKYYLLLIVLVWGCSAKENVSVSSKPNKPQLRMDQEINAGTAVVVLVDTSGSMAHSAGGKPKSESAKLALASIVEQADKWQQAHPNTHLEMGIISFSNREVLLLSAKKFDAQSATKAISKLPSPDGGTAIGRAMKSGYQALYDTGCARKFLICITDGQNTAGPDPESVATELQTQTKGAVRIEFVAFDTSGSSFQFLDKVNGGVVEASDGGQLKAKLTQIYEEKILVEAEE